MARNKLTDLNDHLFAQIERLGDEELTEKELKKEVERAKAITLMAKNIIDNARVTLDAVKYATERLPKSKTLPDQFKMIEPNKF